MVHLYSIGEHVNTVTQTTLEIDGNQMVVYASLRWQVKTEQWLISVQNEEGANLVTNLPLLSGIEGMSSDLLRLFKHKGLGTLAVIPLDDSLTGVDPTRANLSTDYTLAWGDEYVDDEQEIGLD